MAKNTMTWDVPATTDRAIGSMAGNLVSDFFPSANITSGHTLIWTGTPVSDIAVDLSMDGVNPCHVLTSTDLGLTATLPAGSAGHAYFEVVAAAPYRRVRVIRTSGTGTLAGTSVEGVA